MKHALAWEIGAEGMPKRLQPGQIALEKHLEDWLEAEIEIVADDVLLIGRQVTTQYGTKLDLLGIDTRGDLVIIELKRDQTLRETVAQGIEYAAWASKLGYAEVVGLGAAKHGGEEAFRQAFEDRFGMPLPETLNAGQRILLVAPAISEATAAVIAYLAETYRVPINGVSFDVLEMDGRQILIRQTVREESETPEPAGSPRRPNRSREAFITLAKQNHVGEAFEHLLTLEDVLPSIKFFVDGMRFSVRTPDGKALTALNAFPTRETYKHVLAVYVPPQNLARLYGVPLPACEAFVQELQGIGKELPSWGGWPGIGLTTLEQSEAFVRRLREFITAHSTASKEGIPA